MEGEILEERGGLVKVVSTPTTMPGVLSSYMPWVQHAEWFHETSASCELYSYHEIQSKLKNPAQLKGLYEKDSDFEDLKSCAEYSYYTKDYKRSANMWMHILGKYKIGIIWHERSHLSSLR
jgi:hypothetical protein